MGFSSDNPQSAGNMMLSYAPQKAPLVSGIANAIVGSPDPYGLNKDGSASLGFFNPNYSNGVTPSTNSPNIQINPDYASAGMAAGTAAGTPTPATGSSSGSSALPAIAKMFFGG